MRRIVVLVVVLVVLLVLVLSTSTSSTSTSTSSSSRSDLLSSVQVVNFRPPDESGRRSFGAQLANLHSPLTLPINPIRAV